MPSGPQPRFGLVATVVGNCGGITGGGLLADDVASTAGVRSDRPPSSLGLGSDTRQIHALSLPFGQWPIGKIRHARKRATTRSRSPHPRARGARTVVKVPGPFRSRHHPAGCPPTSARLASYAPWMDSSGPPPRLSPALPLPPAHPALRSIPPRKSLLPSPLRYVQFAYPCLIHRHICPRLKQKVVFFALFSCLDTLSINRATTVVSHIQVCFLRKADSLTVKKIYLLFLDALDSSAAPTRLTRTAQKAWENQKTSSQRATPAAMLLVFSR